MSDQPEPIYRCEVCCYWISRDPDDIDRLGPPCPQCLASPKGSHKTVEARRRRTPRMWPAVRPKPNLIW